MTVIQKVDYFIKKLGISEKEFAYLFRIRKNIIAKWRKGEAEPKPENVQYLCDQMGFSVTDFLDNSSTLDESMKFADEHMILGKYNDQKDSDAPSEDFPKEDNSRYEEKD